MNALKKLFFWSQCCVLSTLPFSSSAQAQTLPYYSGFDTPSEKAGWSEYRLGYISTSGWHVGASLSHDYNVGGASTQTVVDWYVSPALNFSTGATVSFKRQSGGFSPPTPDNCEVYFSGSSADPSLGTYTLIGNISSVTVQYTWQDTVLDIPFMTNSGHIAFKYKTIGAAWQMYSIDSIWIKAKPSTVGLIEASDKPLAFEVFPNPVAHSAYLFFNREIQNAAIRIYDLQQRIVFEKSGFCGSEVSLGPSGLMPGIYFLEVDERVSVPKRKKIIIN